MNQHLVIVVTILLWCGTECLALPTGAIKYGSGQVYATKAGSTPIYCGQVGPRFIPGKLVGSAKDFFLSYKQEIKNLTKSLKKLSGSKATRTAAQIKSRKSLNSKGLTACQAGPVPTPTPVSQGNFDFQGNVTAAGKVAFGIPPGLAGNIGTGRLIVQSYCTCHVERLGWGFPAIRLRIAGAPMFFDEAQVSDQMLSDITSYLNRFRP